MYVYTFRTFYEKIPHTFFTFKKNKSYICIFPVVQEYERAVIFRMGRLRSGGARGKSHTI